MLGAEMENDGVVQIYRHYTPIEVTLPEEQTIPRNPLQTVSRFQSFVFGYAASGNVDMLERIFVPENNLDIDMKNSGGNTILFTGAFNGHFNVVKFAHDRGSKGMNMKTLKGTTPFNSAIFRGHGDVVDGMLREKYILAKDVGSDTFNHICRSHHNSIFEILGNHNVYLSRNDRIDVAGNLMDKMGPSMLRHFLKSYPIPKRKDVLQLLSRLTERQVDPFHIWTCFDLTKIDILTHKFQDSTFLFLAVKNGWNKTFAYLIFKGANINSVNENHDCILHCAIVNGSYWIAKFTLSSHMFDYEKHYHRCVSAAFTALQYSQYKIALFILAFFGRRQFEEDASPERNQIYARCRKEKDRLLITEGYKLVMQSGTTEYILSVRRKIYFNLSLSQLFAIRYGQLQDDVNPVKRALSQYSPSSSSSSTTSSSSSSSFES